MRAFYDKSNESFWWAVGDGAINYPVTVVEVSGWPSESHIYNGTEWVLPQEPPMTEETARAKRDALLAESDWTQVADAQVDKAAWATYRQALRDVPQQAGFPDNINWPSIFP